MSTVTAVPEQGGTSPDGPPTSLKPSKRQRPLACVLCQQRKVKCDRNFPCANCIKFRAQCVPATLVPRRRRRHPEKDLLKRLHKYEELLRQNNIDFEPLDKNSSGDKDSPAGEGGYGSDDDQTRLEPSSPSTTDKSGRTYEPKNFWHAMSQGFRDPDNESDSSNDDVRADVVKKAYYQTFQNDNYLLFGSLGSHANIPVLQPEPVQILKMWQIYIANVDPLLKITHNPSLQGRIIEAAGDLNNVASPLAALMFSIYCMAILSITEEESHTMFNSPREDLLARYQYGCQQALLHSKVLRTSDRDCLTALLLYLISLRPTMDPPSLSSMLGVAVRIAQRMGIHNEASNSKCSVLDAEMRRRLWWSLVLIDTRMGELADDKITTLAPTWDCKIPSNVNDSDLRPEMMQPPAVLGASSEAVFAVVRSEIAEFVRHTTYHLDFTNPALKPLGKDANIDSVRDGDALDSLEKRIEEKYLKSCNLENPLHYMTIWLTRHTLAKCRLFEHHSRFSTSTAQQTEQQRDAALSYALRILECDTKIMSSPLTKGYIWLANFYFPFPAYIQILQDLKRRPLNPNAGNMWETMGDNYEERFVYTLKSENPIFKLFSKIVLEAYGAREAIALQNGEAPPPPRIVSYIQGKLTEAAQDAGAGFRVGQYTDFPSGMPLGFGNGRNMLYDTGAPDSFSTGGESMFLNTTRASPLDMDMNQLVWAAMDWDFTGSCAGVATGYSDPASY